jgi:GAF domain-containing protein/predicted Ser/Thr protein kinase
MTTPAQAPTGIELHGTIGKYQIVERIGSGGFGKVFRAWDPVIKRDVAIKVCDAGRDVHARFLREAEVAGGLHHPNITTIYEYGMDGKTPYLVQEFLDGEDLSALIARRELGLADKIRILVGISVGLEHAHRAGVVHRDVKPANVRILANGTVKIMDFGIAKALDSPSQLTGSGITVGSSAYMAPEQVTGDPVDARTDIFSFGCLAFELLSAQRPFLNENLFRLLEMIVKEEPIPGLGELEPTLPAGLVALVERSMRKDPAQRFSSLREVRSALVAAFPDAAASAMDEPSESLPEPEAERWAALQRYGIDDTSPEPAFEDLAVLAARVCAATGGAVSFVAPRRIWVKAAVGEPRYEDSRESGFCAHAILGRDVFVVPDATMDGRFREHPAVGGEGLRFYAAAPVVTPEGVAIGALSVVDRQARELSPEQCQGLRIVAAQVVAHLELRRHRRHEMESSGEKMLLEAAGLGDEPFPAVETPDHE